MEAVSGRRFEDASDLDLDLDKISPSIFWCIRARLFLSVAGDNDGESRFVLDLRLCIRVRRGEGDSEGKCCRILVFKATGVRNRSASLSCLLFLAEAFSLSSDLLIIRWPRLP